MLLEFCGRIGVVAVRKGPGKVGKKKFDPFSNSYSPLGFMNSLPRGPLPENDLKIKYPIGTGMAPTNRAASKSSEPSMFGPTGRGPQEALQS
jgi:hypothetical protein